MSKLIRQTYRAEIMKSDGGIIKCRKCGRVTGFIYEGNHTYIKYIFLCDCTNFGKVELSRGKKPRLEYPGRKIYQKESLHICPNCERELFWVEDTAVVNYAFNAVCKCGVEYDTKYIIKRLD